MLKPRNVQKSGIRGLFLPYSGHYFSPLKIRRVLVRTFAMKRSAPLSKTASKSKKPRIEIPDYHRTPTVKDEHGDPIWPAPREQIAVARNFIQECAGAKKKTVICPDKDADGLTSGVVLYRTLTALGLPEELIYVHLLSKGTTIADESEREALAEKQPDYIFILDHGSISCPPLVPRPHKSLVIDHHQATDSDFPSGSQHVTACNSPPVATTSLLTYHLCSPLHPSIADTCAWLCIVGTTGDLGGTLKWQPPFPDMAPAFKKHTKSSLNDAVSLLNAPRRTSRYDVHSAWTAVLAADGPSSILQNRRLREARAEVSAEVERCTHTAPKFSADATIAVLRISSAAQVHPVIATRWAGHLSSQKLEVVMCANEGYLDGMVNFSCRVAKGARNRETPVNIIEVLKGIVERGESGGLRERLGAGFARGHKEASGGIVEKEAFEEFVKLMGVGEKAAKADGEGMKRVKTVERSPQKNTLMNYFGKSKVGQKEEVKGEVV